MRLFSFSILSLVGQGTTGKRGEELEYRLFDNYQQAESLMEFIEAVKTKR